MKTIVKSKQLKSNTLMLYLLTFSNYFFAFVTIPYLSRLLQPELYGLIAFAMATMVYFQLIVDFGFILSSTQRVAEYYDDVSTLRKITTSVFIAKLLLSIICFLTLSYLECIFDSINKDNTLFYLFLFNTVISSLLPDYLYRGLEVMKVITIRTVIIKGLFTFLIFLFLKDRNEYIYIPLFYLIGSVVAVVWSYYDIYKRFDVYFVRVKFMDVIEELRLSIPFFVSRIASTVYGASNTLVLKMIYPTNVEIGFYTSADKVISISRSASSPISDSIYPYMIKHKDYKLFFNIIKIALPIILASSIILWFNAVPICVFIFGEQYYNTGNILRYMIPLMVFVLPNYLFGFPSLVPLKLGFIANLSVLIGSGLHFLGLCILFYLEALDIISICILTCFTEGIILLIRVVATFYGLNKLKNLNN